MQRLLLVSLSDFRAPPTRPWLGPPNGPLPAAGPGDPSESAIRRDRGRANAVTHPTTETLQGGTGRGRPQVPTRSRVSQGDVTGGRWTPTERWRHSNPKLPSALGLPHRNPTPTTTLALGRGAALIGPGPTGAASGRRPVQ